MAKAGFWLKGARGKLAGASLQKGADGETVMREIVTPKNPKTTAQLIQRTLMATVQKAYGQMKEITDHSFEGIAAGQATMARFLKVNANALRARACGGFFMMTRPFSLCKSVPFVHSVHPGVFPKR